MKEEGWNILYPRSSVHIDNFVSRTFMPIFLDGVFSTKERLCSCINKETSMDLAGPFNRIHPSTNSEASRSPFPEVSILGWKCWAGPSRLIGGVWCMDIYSFTNNLELKGFPSKLLEIGVPMPLENTIISIG